MVSFELLSTYFLEIESNFWLTRLIDHDDYKDEFDNADEY